MNILIKTWKKNEEEWDEKFVCVTNKGNQLKCIHLSGKDISKDLKNYNRQAQINILKALVGDCGGREREHKDHCIALNDGYGHKFRDCNPDCQANGYNKSLDDTITTLNEFIKYLEEL